MKPDIVKLSAVTLCVLSPAFAEIKGQAAREILEKNCYGCHGAAQMSGLDLRQRDAILKGGKRGAAIVPGAAAASLLYQAVAGKGELKMPPGKQSLSAADVEHYEHIIGALSETIRLISEIDAVVERDGGLPDAFANLGS